MRRLGIILIMGATCQAAQPVVGHMEVYPQIAAHDQRRAEPFIMPTDGTIDTLSIYHEGGGGRMLLGVYLGDTAPDVRLGVTPPTVVSAQAGWQAVPLTDPLWVPGGTRIWLAWLFETNPGIRYQTLPTGWVESDETWDLGMPGLFGDCRQANCTHSIYATYLGNVHPVINEVLCRNDSLSERSFLDEDWRKQGWIELYNPSNLSIHLRDYYLSDRQDDPQKWAFPDVVLAPQGYVQVWTSGYDRSDPDGELHTSFNLMDSEGVYLTHVTPDNPIDVLEEIRIPIDYSYGRYPDGANNWYFYTQPTPRSTNTVENKKRFVIDQRHVSLSAGSRYQLTVTPSQEEVVWSSDNPLVWVDPEGGLFAVRDALGEDAQATITASSVAGDQSDSCRVTIVNWAANLSELEVVATPPAHYILATEGETLFYLRNRDLYSTSDSFTTSEFLATLDEAPDIPKMLVTPFGYFLECAKTIFKSDDLVTWTPTHTMHMRSLVHGLAYHFDPSSQTGYVYASEYSCDPNERHRVCRGVFPATGEEVWQTVLDFASPNAWREDPSLLEAARHVHAVAVDPYTGHVWVCTGDSDLHSRLLYSDDQGDSFQLVGTGSQDWRTLSIWFTERYVYWSMDAYSYAQCCWRIPRSQFDEGGRWPCVTPELASGTTTIGVNYLVTANEADGHFPVSVGHTYRETQTRSLSQRDRVRALDDPEYDYKEKVAELRNGSLWYHLWVHDDHGDPVVILAQSAEGAHRDYRGRVFGLKELADGRVDVQELLSVESIDPAIYDERTMFVQLEPMAQDARGYIYFTGRWTNQRIYQTRLTWVDNPALP